MGVGKNNNNLPAAGRDKKRQNKKRNYRESDTQ
jgi:hypothetical protein